MQQSNANKLACQADHIMMKKYIEGSTKKLDTLLGVVIFHVKGVEFGRIHPTNEVLRSHVKWPTTLFP